jgi:hypothetical protein
VFYTTSITTGGTAFCPTFQREEETPMRKLYEIYLVNKKTLEVKQFLQVADSEEDARIAAIIEAGIPVSELRDWVKEAIDIADVPEAE